MTTIRDATENDYEAIARLYQQVHELHAAHRADLFVPGAEGVFPADKFEKLRTSETEDILVAEQDGEVVGVAHMTFSDMRDRVWSALQGRAHIEAIVVDEQFRRQGIGKALMLAAEDRAAERGADWVSLGVHGFNTAARKAYEDAGYGLVSLSLGKPLKPKAPHV